MAGLSRGAILSTERNGLVVVWGHSNGVTVGMPMHRQTGPRKRSQLVVSVAELQILFGEGVVTVPLLIETDTESRVIGAEDGAHQVATLGPDYVNRLQVVMDRDREASLAERQTTLRWSG